MSAGRILALCRRYAYPYRRGFTRVLELFFWPIMDLFLWGFVTTYLTGQQHVPAIVTFLLAGAMLWNVLYRSQLSMTVSFLEDIWTRNLMNLFIAPVRLSEFLAATALLGLIRTTIVMGLMALMASLFYSFNVGVLGLALIPLFANLVWLGWSLGMVTMALILRYGQAAENLAWAVPFLFQPVSAVFYPVATLPAALRPLALALPSTHVFEGMRDALAGRGFPTAHLLSAVGLNVLFFAAACAFFVHMYRIARERALLARLATQ